MKQEYIVCDVVEYDNEVMIINTQIDSNYFQLFCLKREMCCSVCKNMIIPILLSTLILKNNGWDITEVNCEDENPELHYETFSKCRIMADIRYYPNWSDDNRKFFVFVDSEEILHFKYVHELQHLLWAMGKDSTMIV